MNQGGRESVGFREAAAATLTVRLSALVANYREACRRAGPASVAAVVKANAYGLGMGPVAKALSAAGADTFFVARLEEAITLRAGLPRARIFVLDGIATDTGPALFAYRLIPVLNTMQDLEQWSALANREKRILEAALQIDTGMNRCGFSLAELPLLRDRLAESRCRIHPVLIMSHLACADEPEHGLNRRQVDRFRSALAALPGAPASLAASAGIELGRDYLFDLVREGLAHCGGNPVPSRPNPYRAVAALTGRVLQARHLAPGESAGYGAAFVAARPTTVAIVALGYADGLFRVISAKGCAALGGLRVPFAGRISMDLVALDVTLVPPAAVYPGAEVEFFGDTVSLQDVADASGTIAHEVLTSIGPRARRVYLDA